MELVKGKNFNESGFKREILKNDRVNLKKVEEKIYILKKMKRKKGFGKRKGLKKRRIERMKRRSNENEKEKKEWKNVMRK